METINKSEFDGSVLGSIGISLLTTLICLCTFSIAYPWVICMEKRWYTSHTIIDRQRLTFDGRGGQLFGRFMLWILLSIITCGIYIFWAHIKLQKWVTEHTHVA